MTKIKRPHPLSSKDAAAIIQKAGDVCKKIEEQETVSTLRMLEMAKAESQILRQAFKLSQSVNETLISQLQTQETAPAAAIPQGLTQARLLKAPRLPFARNTSK